MPYIVISGQLTGPQHTGAEGTLIAGLPAHERDTFVAELEDWTPGCSKVSGSGSVRIDGRGRVLHLLNRLHDKYGYEVISHSMALTTTNHERMSWTLFRKHSSTNSNHSQRAAKFI